MLFNEKKKKLTAREFEKEVERLVEFVKGSVSPFTSDTKAKQQARVKRAREDQDFFNETYLPHYFSDESPDFHREMEELEQEGERQRRPVAIAAPRGFSKSTRITFARRLKRGLFGEKKFIVIVGADESLAAEFTVSIRTELEHNVRIIHDFGKQKTAAWAAGDFAIKGGTRYWARGTGQRIRGEKHGPYRPDDIVIDDPETDELVRNPERVRQLLKWVREAVYPSLDPKSRILSWVGTILSQRSALAQILKDPAWITRIFRAVTNPEWDEETKQFISGVSLWQERFPLAELSRIRFVVGSPAFQKEYQNDPRDDEALFQEEWIRKTRFKWSDAPAGLLTTQGIDPSLRQGQSNDFKANVTSSHNGPQHYVRHAWIKKASILNMVKTAYLLHEKFSSQIVGLEAEGWQELLLPEFYREAGERGYPLPIMPIRQHGIAKVDESRIAGLSPLVENGFLRFAQGPASEIGDIELLIEQLLSFPSTTVNDDGPDALEFSIRVATRRAAEPRVRAIGSSDKKVNGHWSTVD